MSTQKTGRIKTDITRLLEVLALLEKTGEFAEREKNCHMAIDGTLLLLRKRTTYAVIELSVPFL